MVYNWLKYNLSRPGTSIPDCLVCQLPSDTAASICSFCLNHLPRPTSWCRGCAQPFNHDELHQQLCGRCQLGEQHFDRVISPFIYAPPVDRFITQLKFQQRLHFAPVLAQLFYHAWPHQEPLPQALLPVPLHNRRLTERGFNQSLEISRFLSKYFALPVVTDQVDRVKLTAAQHTLPRKQRQSNLKQAFEARGKARFRHYAIVDDVMTTGTTVNAIAYQLKLSGAEQVDVWTIARSA